MAPRINWGTVVSDPAEQADILGKATDFVNRNDVGAGGAQGYLPGHSRDEAIANAAYMYFPQASPNRGAGGIYGALPGSGVGAPTFGGTAPTATPYGTFAAPNPADVASDPYYQFRASQGQDAIQHAAAARGTLLNGGTLKALEGYRQGLASEEAGKAFDRALRSYETNRATNAQNYGQSMDQFRGNLGAFGANTDAALGYGRLGLEAGSQAFTQGRQLWLDQQEQARERAAMDAAANARSFAESVASARGALPGSTLAVPRRGAPSVQEQASARDLIARNAVDAPAALGSPLASLPSFGR